MKNFKLINTISGWATFVISSIVYLMTMEPTASFWDCGEFIATAFKLEVGHPPGAPVFMFLARIFSLFAGDVTQVAVSVNALSAIASSLTILFLYFSISHLARKMLAGKDDFSIGKALAVIGSGLVGSMAYAFSDTFWFSAVEAEVYATSSLFTALVFWAILKWEDEANERYSNRWLILIAYLMGISIGIHLLNLLAIPAIVFVYYFKKYKPTVKGIIASGLISVVILAGIMYGVISGAVKLAGQFELLFVNGFGLPFNSGIIFYFLTLAGLLVFLILYSSKHRKAILNTVVLSFTVILIGYSSFIFIVVRSQANTPIDENNPDHIFSLLSYLNREQYGDRPLLFGQYYNAPIESQKDGLSTYIQENGKYRKIEIRPDYQYDSRFLTLFPRMYSQQDDHITVYKEWGKVKGTPIQTTNQRGEPEVVNKPTFGENLRFFFNYQFNHMYWRYFMWNFAGRQNDIQGHGGILKGNWITGIPALDNNMLGPQDQDKLPPVFAGNRANNKLYLLPLLLGLVGLFIQYRKNNHGFWVVMLLFFFTGVAIVLYLNQTPLQPRERDYAYAGSFYAFAIWIGLGIAGLFSLLRKYINETIVASGLTIVLLALVPGIMASENWDDHDRSNRYIAHDFAYNILNSCEKNSILFTFGDNDTFPVWYMQEVEGVRTDVRVVNLSLLSTDWYIDQMKRQAYDSPPVPFTFTFDQYIQGTRDQVFVYERTKDTLELNKVMEFVGSDDPQAKINLSPTQAFNYIPTKHLRLAVPREKVLKNGTVSQANAEKIVPAIEWSLNKQSLLKADLMVLDILLANKWERPVYFAVSAGSDSYLGLDEYLQLEGMAYRLVPLRTVDQQNTGRVETNKLFSNLMTKFKWGNIGQDKTYIDDNIRRMTIILNIRSSYGRLAEELAREGKKEEAKKVIARSIEIMPESKFPFDYYMLPIIKACYEMGDTVKANELTKKVFDNYYAEADYYLSLSPAKQALIERDRNIAKQVMQIMLSVAQFFKQDELEKELLARFNKVQG
jgi:hypothetical protein